MGRFFLQTVGKVVEVDRSISGPGVANGECPCDEDGGSQGDHTVLQLFHLAGGYGAIPPHFPVNSPTAIFCSCSLSPVISFFDSDVDEDEVLHHQQQQINLRGWGRASSSHLLPPLFRSGARMGSLPISASVRQLRRAVHCRRFPAALERPAYGSRWEEVLGIGNDARASEMEWKKRWLAVSWSHLSGPSRSFLWLLTHRRTPLLYKPWIRLHYNIPSGRCVLCTDSIVESFQHLFSECSFASLLWNFIAPLMTELGFDFYDNLPARMIGDISKYDPRSLLQAVWTCEHTPSAGKIREWVRYMWAEIRGVAVKTIWDARCELLHNRNNDIPALQVLASHKLTCTLRLFVLMKTPSRFRDASASSRRSDEVENFYRLTWGKIAPQILHLTPHQWLSHRVDPVSAGALHQHGHAKMKLDFSLAPSSLRVSCS